MKALILLAVFVLGAAAITPALAQEETSPPNLPPLIINSPEDHSVTQASSTYWYAISLSDFLFVDDGDADPVITCTIDGDTQTITNAYHSEASAIGAAWNLTSGIYPAVCELTDEGGRMSSATHTVSVDAVTPLFGDPAHSSKVKRITYLAVQGHISWEWYDKIIKYFHRAGIIDFDIVRDGSGGFTSYHQYQSYCTQGGAESYAHKYWQNDSYSSADDVFYKQCLEALAERGVYERIDLGF